MHIPSISKETEERLILSILNAYRQRPQPSWGITIAGWEHYTTHWSPKVRAAVRRHPYAFTEASYSPYRACQQAA